MITLFTLQWPKWIRAASASKTVRVNITLPDQVLSWMDAYAHGESRSGFLARAALAAMTD